jgi:hypothetical protein
MGWVLRKTSLAVEHEERSQVTMALEVGGSRDLETQDDVFLSYHWRDHAAVEAVARQLREDGLTVFLDRWYLVPDRPWPQALEAVLHGCHAVAVFLGPRGMDPWQQWETGLALNRQARDPTFPVIPVLLPSADPALGFLGLNTWVDLWAGLDDLWALAVLAAAVRRVAPGPHLQARLTVTLATICPYRGLRPVREEDAPFFFGRETFRGRMVEAVSQHPLVAVVGASGSGKSSVVRAGLVPQLRRGSGGRVWDVVTLVPGDRPLHALAAALIPLLEPEMTETDRLAEVGKLAQYLGEGRVTLRDVVARALHQQLGTDRLLLVADQWEELYTLTQDEPTRHRFIDEVLDAAATGSLSVVLTLRGDFFGQVLGDRILADRLQGAVVHLGPMLREELQLAVEAPAHQVGLTFERGLVSRILDTVDQAPGKLPLLEFVLSGLWETRREGQLRHETYEAMGELQGAIAQRADETFERLMLADQETARRVFLQLVRPGEDTADTRRRATCAELGDAVQPVVRVLADARLVVTGRDEATGEQTLEVAHEALIRHWRRLRNWLDQDREFLLWHQRLRGAVAEWEHTEHDAGGLLRGAPLAEAERWVGERPNDLTPAERRLIQESVALRKREQGMRDQRRRRFTGAIIGVLVVLLLLAFLAWQQRNTAIDQAERAMAAQKLAEVHQDKAEQQTALALSRGLAAEARNYLNKQLDPALLLSVEAHRRAETPEVRQALYTALDAARSSLFLHGHQGDVWRLIFSPDGKTLAFGGPTGTLLLWDLRVIPPRRATLPGHQDQVRALAFSSSGNIFASGD